MEIDNSRANAFRTCPWMYYEQYLRNGTGVEPNPSGESYTPLEFGARGHELMQEHYLQNTIYEPSPNEALEAEAQLTLAAYKAKYPDEQLDIVDVERTIRVQLPDFCTMCYRLSRPYLRDPAYAYCEHCRYTYESGRHIYTGKMDLVVRNEGLYDIWDHKFEKRGAKSNLPQKWSARDQASLYWWAAEKMYGPNIGNFYVNVVTRQSPKGQEPPTFPDRQKLERNERQKEIAVRDIVIIADEIERYTKAFGDGEWPANREKCYEWGYCPYYQLHRYGEDVTIILEHRYQPKKPYLDLAGVPIIQ